MDITLREQMDIVGYGTVFEVVRRESKRVVYSGVWEYNSEVPEILRSSVIFSIVVCGNGLRIEIEEKEN